MNGSKHQWNQKLLRFAVYEKEKFHYSFEIPWTEPTEVWILLHVTWTWILRSVPWLSIHECWSLVLNVAAERARCRWHFQVFARHHGDVFSDISVRCEFFYPISIIPFLFVISWLHITHFLSLPVGNRFPYAVYSFFSIVNSIGCCLRIRMTIAAHFS